MNKMIMAPVDILARRAPFPRITWMRPTRDLSKFLGAYGMKGKIKISVALARSSLIQPGRDGELNAKRLSDWLPVEVVFKNPHPKC